MNAQSKNQPMRIAVTGVSGDIGMGAIAGLEASRDDVFLLGLDCFDDCAGFHLVDAHHTVPMVRDPSYVETLIETLNAHRIELLFVGVDAEVPVAARYKAEVQARTQAVVVALDPQWTDIFTDKIHTVAFLAEHGLPALTTFSAAEDISAITARLTFPMIVKPRAGHGSVGIDIVHTEAELREALQTRGDDDCVQQYIDGPEYTVGLTYDRDGKLADHVVCSRVLKNGRTMKCTVVHDASLDALTKQFAAAASLFGAVNLQLRTDASGTPFIFEVNGRLSGSTEMRVALGFNDPLRLAGHLVRGEPIAKASVQDVTVYRTWRNVVVPNQSEVSQ